LHFLDVILQKWSEVSPVAEPEQGPELLLELVLQDADLLIDALLTILVNSEHVVEQEYRQLIRSFDLNLIRAEEFHK